MTFALSKQRSKPAELKSRPWGSLKGNTECEAATDAEVVEGIDGKVT